MDKPGFYIDSPRTVGINPPGTFQAFRQVSGSAWTAHISDGYSLSWNQVGNGLDFSNSINTDSGWIKSFGVMWDLGTAAGSQTVSYEMVFSDAPLPVPARMAAPTGVAGDSSVTVSIVAPADNGSAITGYTVTSAPGAVTCSIAAGESSCLAAGLTNGSPYTFTAAATSGNGTSLASPASAPLTPGAPPAGSSATPTVASGPAFLDIPAGEMATAASWLAGRGITLGCESGLSPRFCPSDLATRAEVATFLSRALMLLASDVDAFRDDDGHLLEESLNRTAAADVFMGCSLDRDVCPDDEITRGELAAVLVRAFDLAVTTPAVFSDVDHHWAESFIQTIGGLGISVGCAFGENRFCPGDLGTRGEIALFLFRALSLE